MELRLPRQSIVSDITHLAIGQIKKRLTDVFGPTIQQILDGRQREYPLHRRDATFKKAPRSRAAAAENRSLFEG